MVRLWGNNRAIHSCQSPACCNPEHIYVVRDLAAALAEQRANGRIGGTPQRLSRAAAEQMRADHAAGMTFLQLSAKNVVRVPAVRAVILGRTWKPKGGA